MSELLRLAELCEKAMGADRELDVAIVYALHPGIGPYRPYCQGEEPIFWDEPFRKQPCPEFTGSIDAAMTLVPKGFASAVGTMAFEGEDRKPWGCYWEPNGKASRTFEAATPALALCAASLRAADTAGVR